MAASVSNPRDPIRHTAATLMMENGTDFRLFKSSSVRK